MVTGRLTNARQKNTGSRQGMFVITKTAESEISFVENDELSLGYSAGSSVGSEPDYPAFVVQKGYNRILSESIRRVRKSHT
jgi:hypothetical protein